MSNSRKRFYIDLAERVGATYVEVLVGLLIAGWADVGELGAWSVAETAAIAAVPAGLAVLKGGLASFRGDRDDASLAQPPLAQR